MLAKYYIYSCFIYIKLFIESKIQYISVGKMLFYFYISYNKGIYRYFAFYKLLYIIQNNFCYFKKNIKKIKLKILDIV